MILPAEAERAKDITSILGSFRGYDPDNRKSIEATIDQLKDLSAVLRDLDKLIEAQDGVVSRNFADDLELLQHSVAYTLADLWTILGNMPDQCIGHDYRATWKEIVAHCRNTRKQSLHMRIEMYALFAAALCRQLRSQPQSRAIHLDEIRSDIIQLRRAQLGDRRLITAADAINDLSGLALTQPLPPPPLTSTAMRQPRSTERVRPPNIRTMSPTESNTSRESTSRPFVPSPPMSPQSPTTTYSTISQASSGEIETQHWAGRIFKDLPSTRIHDEKNLKAVTRCFPLHSDDGRSWPKTDQYDPILKIHFPGGLRLHYYVRDKDYRAKIACDWPNDRRRIQHSCLPLNELHSKRDGSLLYLCRAVAGVSSSTVWTVFKFPTIEFLIVFHCTFLALRSQDGRRHFRDLFDHELKGETRVFAGVISDGEYHHALRIYRDRVTSTLRLEAAVLEGALKDTPVWTAFITHQVTSPTWMKRSDRSRRVYLADLKRHIFTSQYTPHVAASGQHVLAFDLLADAEAFSDTIKDLGIRYWEDARKAR